MRNLLRLVLRTATWIEEQLGGLLLLAAAALVFLQIVLRMAGYSLSGLYELAAFCAIWSVFLTAGVGIQRNIHVRVDLLLLICPPPLARLLQIAGTLMMIAMALALCYSGTLLVDESLMFGDSTLGTINIPMWIPQLIMPLGGLLMLIHALAHLLEILRAPAARPQPEGQDELAATINL